MTEIRWYDKPIERQGWTEVYLTSVLKTPVEEAAGIAEHFDRLAARAREQGLEILQDKVYGDLRHEDEILAIRERAYAEHGLCTDVPPTFIDGRPCIGGVLSGVQIAAAVPKADRVSVDTLRHDGAVVGRVLELPDRRMLFLAGVSGADGAADASVAAQGDRMFRRAVSTLAREGAKPRDIVRTWIYLPRLLDWYGEFNRVRTAIFEEFGFFPEDGPPTVPASTGIQGRRSPGEECFMDVLAIVPRDGDGPADFEAMRNPRQNEAYEYGSSFARGMVVRSGGPPSLYISGTASIDTTGHTVHHGDSQNQIMETLLDIASLIEGHGAHLKDICQATAYCKTPKDYETFERILRHLDLGSIPFVPVYADVCRDELLFEVDSVAVPGLAGIV